jgi:putative ABC transport system permease protein
MFKHYLTTALRHLARHKTTTVINVLCLALGLICFAVAYGIVEYYRNADLYHEKADRTYVVTQRSQVIDASTSVATLPFSGWSVAPHLKSDYPELEIVARAVMSQEVAVATEGAKTYVLASFADPEYLDVFDLPFVAGDRRTALRSPRSAVIKEDLARQLFGTSNAMGKELLLNNLETVRITGIVRAPKQPTHIAAKFAGKVVDFSLLVSMDTGAALVAANSPDTAFTANRSFNEIAFTYVVFRQNSAFTPEQLRADLPRFTERHVPPTFGHVTFGLRPVSEILDVLADIVMRSHLTGFSNHTMVLILGAMALAAACLNYANLASAQATTRLKELALRRVVGASHRQIVAQALFEAALVIVGAAALALALLPGIVKALHDSTALDIGSQLYFSRSFWIWTIASLVTVTLLACSYPAVVATRIRPAHALQHSRAPTSKRRALYCLVVAQFAIASFLFVATSVMHSQNERMHPARTYDDDPIVVISNNTQQAGVDSQLLQTELRNNGSIKQVSAIDTTPGEIVNYHRGRMLSSANLNSTHWANISLRIDHYFFKTMGIPLLAGREFDLANSADLATPSNTSNVVIDRALAAEYGWPNPGDAVGKQIYMASNLTKNTVGIPRTVIGVVDNALLVPMVMDGSTSTVYSLDPRRATILVVRLSRSDVAGGLRAIESVWNSLAPNIPLKQQFFDEQFEVSFKMMTGMLSVFRALALMSILVGALGLLGIATHTVNQRRFEIGIRRTLGASVQQVLFMLLKDFAMPIVLANIIAWPLAFVVAKAYASFFADKATLTIMPFIASLLLGLVIAWLAVLRQATSAARMNPASVLRHE